MDWDPTLCSPSLATDSLEMLSCSFLERLLVSPWDNVQIIDELDTEGTAILFCGIAVVMISRHPIRAKLLVLESLQEAVGRVLAQYSSVGWLSFFTK